METIDTTNYTTMLYITDLPRCEYRPPHSLRLRRNRRERGEWGERAS